MGVTPAVSLRQTYDAVPESVRAARQAIFAVAVDAGFDSARLADVWLATSEALTNVVKHAYEDGRGTIEVDAVVAGGELCVLIADHGRGLRPHASGSGGLGLGLMLIVAVSDEAAISKRSGGGTQVSLRFRLGFRGDAPRGRRQSRGSDCSATVAAASRFSTTT